MSNKIVPLRAEISPLSRRVLQVGDPVRRRAVQPVLGGFGPGAPIEAGQAWIDGMFAGWRGTHPIIEYADGTLEVLMSRADLLE